MKIKYIDGTFENYVAIDGQDIEKISLEVVVDALKTVLLHTEKGSSCIVHIFKHAMINCGKMKTSDFIDDGDGLEREYSLDL